MSFSRPLIRYVIKETNFRRWLREPHFCIPTIVLTTNPRDPFTCHPSTVNAFFQLHQKREFRLSSFLLEDIQVVTPPFPESINDGDVKWLKDDGAEVQKDEAVCEIETDKTAIPVTSPAAGKIKRLVEDGQKVEAGNVLFTVTAAAGSGKSAPAPKPAPTKQTPPKPPSPTTQVNLKRGETITKMSRIRKTISQRLKDAQNTYVMLTTYNEIDMSYVIDFRKKHQQEHVKKHGVKLGFMSAFVKAVTYALQDQPVFNSHIQDQTVVKKKFIDISIAVAAPKGLLVPVLRDVEKMKLWEIEKGIIGLSKKARDGTIEKADMEGGSFTITNGGIFGSLISMPLINPPQSGILGMHGIFERPVAIKNQVVIRPMMYVALTYDHRLVDGREAVLFLRRVKKGVEDVEQLAKEL